MLVRRTHPLPVECVARGYLEGSGWKDYQATGALCGHRLPAGLRQCDRLPEPLFTPATKAESGHDENISEAQAAAVLGDDVFAQVKALTLALYGAGAAHAAAHGIMVADTKFEFGLVDEDGATRVLLIDEVLTPDSSRFWPADQYAPGGPQPSFDKQFVRDYLERIQWNKQPPVPSLPEDVVVAHARQVPRCVPPTHRHRPRLSDPPWKCTAPSNGWSPRWSTAASCSATPLASSSAVSSSGPSSAATAASPGAPP